MLQTGTSKFLRFQPLDQRTRILPQKRHGHKYIVLYMLRRFCKLDSVTSSYNTWLRFTPGAISDLLKNANEI